MSRPILDAESAVLGAMMISPDAFWRIADTLTADDFSSGIHRRLFGCVSAMIRNGDAADAVTVGELHPDLFDDAVSIASAAFSTANVVGYAEAVARAAMERRVVAAGKRIASLSGAEAYADALRILESCAPRVARKAVTLRDAMRGWFQKASDSASAANDTELTGLPTSIAWLDEQTGGWQPGDLVILAARPSVGKTAFGLQTALHAGLAGHASLFFSAEMSSIQVADRAVSQLGRVSTQALRRPKTMTDEDWSAASLGVSRGNSLPVWIDDSNGITAIDIAARARQVNAERRLSLIVVDYLQLLRHPKSENRNIAIGETTGALKALAKQLQVPVLLLSQLNREAASTRPQMQHIRDSGNIEQDADVVMFLHRPDESQKEKLELILSKQRNGSTGEMWLDADYAHMTFTAGDAPFRDEATAQRRGFGAPRKVASSGNRYWEK